MARTHEFLDPEAPPYDFAEDSDISVKCSYCGNVVHHQQYPTVNWDIDIKFTEGEINENNHSWS